MPDRRRPARVLGLLLAAALLLDGGAARAVAPAARLAVLARGVNIVHWFRFPPSNQPAALEHDLDAAAIVSLRQAGFTFVRLPVGLEEVMRDGHVDPARLAVVVSVVGRLEQAGLGVLVTAFPEQVHNWDLQHDVAARARLLGFWREMAPALRRLPPGLTFPELVNEPTTDAATWDTLQRQLLAIVRAALPADTVILTGSNWGSIDGLLAAQPLPDRDVVYSVHTYEPQLLAILGSWDSAIKGDQLARVIPFPVTDEAACRAQVAPVADAHTLASLQWWCGQHAGPQSVRENLERAARWGHEHDASVGVFEFGALGSLNRPARLAYLAAVRTGAESLHMPWALWGLDEQMGLDQQPGAYHDAGQLPRATMTALGLSGGASAP